MGIVLQFLPIGKVHLELVGGGIELGKRGWPRRGSITILRAGENRAPNGFDGALWRGERVPDQKDHSANCQRMRVRIVISLVFKLKRKWFVYIIKVGKGSCQQRNRTLR